MDIAISKKIPGMVETIEQQMLFEAARSQSLFPGEVIVEFGAFFGRSTYCLAEGMMANPALVTQRLYTYDSFSCPQRGRFAGYVSQFAETNGVADKLRVEAGVIDFRQVFEHYLSPHLGTGLIQTCQGSLAHAVPPEGEIALMHVDCPKSYADLKYILYRFFPELRTGARVIFQDFFYHWSASLIAAVQLLVDLGLLVMKGSAASSLHTEVARKPDLKLLLQLDLRMQETGVPTLIERAFATVTSVELDRPQQFLPRLLLAKVQYLWEIGYYPQAAATMDQLMHRGQLVNEHLLNDYLDLMRWGFSARKRYGADEV